MKPTRQTQQSASSPLAGFAAAVAVLVMLLIPGSFALVARAQSQSGSDNSSSSDNADKKSGPPPTARLKIQISDPHGKPVAQASVYVRYNQTTGVFHKEKLAEMDLKTNDDGTVKAPDIPQGKVMIQVIAKGWRTYGRWYDVDKSEDTIEIKLQEPPHWY
jgi:hypothetical protein